MPALRIYLQHTAGPVGWTVSFLDELTSAPDADMVALPYRIAQEAVVNARKHAEATSVRIEVVEAADGIVVRAIDDGRGFVPTCDRIRSPGTSACPRWWNAGARRRMGPCDQRAGAWDDGRVLAPGRHRLGRSGSGAPRDGAGAADELGPRRREGRIDGEPRCRVEVVEA